MPTKVHLVKAMIFPVVMYGCESWTIKKAEHWRTDAFELWCWKRLLRVPWTARRSNQSILKEISPEYSLEGLMLKLKLQNFGHLLPKLTHLKRPWCWERLNAGGEGDDRGWDGWMASPTQWTWDWVNSGSWWWTGRPGMLQSMGSQRVGHNWVTELNWTEGRTTGQRRNKSRGKIRDKKPRERVASRARKCCLLLKVGVLLVWGWKSYIYYLFCARLFVLISFNSHSNLQGR